MDHYVKPLSRSTAEDDTLSDDQDESLSLRDLPLTPPRSSTTVDPPLTNNHSRRSSATSDFLFEFLVNHDDFATSPADDVMFCGRLLPSAPPPPRRSLSLSSARHRLFNEPKPQLNQSAIRPSRSLNCRKMRRNSSSKSDLLPRNSSNSCRSFNSDRYKVGAAAGNGGSLKSPWYWLAFGVPTKVPVEMELKDIKSRQCRRSTPPPVPGSLSGERCSSASWRLLNVLSCKSHASVDVRKTAPFQI